MLFSQRLDSPIIPLLAETYDSNDCWSSRLQEPQNEAKLSRQAQALEIYWATSSKLLSLIMERTHPKTAADQNKLFSVKGGSLRAVLTTGLHLSVDFSSSQTITMWKRKTHLFRRVPWLTRVDFPLMNQKSLLIACPACWEDLMRPNP